MTNPPPIPPPNGVDPNSWALMQTLQTTVTTLSATVTTLGTTVTDLKRIVEGDSAMGVPSLREAMRKHEEAQTKRMDDLETRLDKSEEEKKLADARLNTVWNIVKFLGGGTAVGLVGLILQLSGVFGGHK